MRRPLSIAVLVNEAAGTVAGHSEVVAELRTLLHEAGAAADIVPLEPGSHVTAIARDAAARASIVVAAGGDGTVRGVAAGVVDSSAALGVLPLGTLNHFAKDLRLPLGLREAVAVVAKGHVQRVDIGRVNDAIFLNNSSLGVYPSVVQRREALRLQGHGKWKAMALAIVGVLREHPGIGVRIDVHGHLRTRRTPFIFIGNNEYAIEGLQLGGRARLDGGQLFVYLLPRTRTRDLPLLLARAVIGRAARTGAFEIVAATDARVDTFTRAPLQVALDGEVETMSQPLHYRICPGALRVVVPET
jgi:diacylglycerol kinase family enzyme